MKKWIICSGPNWYSSSITSTKQLMRLFRENGYRVLWVNPIAFKSPFVNSANRKSAMDRIRSKLLTHLRWLRRNAEKQWILVPFYVPLFKKWSEVLNRCLICVQVRLICLVLCIRIKETILWVSGNFTVEALLDWPFRKKVYQAADLISAFRNASPKLKETLEARERNLCRKVDVIFPASKRISEGLMALYGADEKIHLLHHGVDFNHFSKTILPPDSMLKIRSMKRPVAGYFGSLSDANDKNVFLNLADNGFSVVLIGTPVGDYEKLRRHPHIHFLGSIHYADLPAYATAFDVALLNWRMHDWILNCFPVKALEYLTLGLPIVSCKIPVLMEYFANVISFAQTADEFYVEAKRLVADDTPELRRKRRKSVCSWSWDNRFQYIEEVLSLK